MKIGKIIHYYRKKNNMTQEELAFRLGVSGATISKWENNLSYPETSLLPKISDIFDISINQLFNNDFVLVSIIDNIIDDVNDPKKYDLQNAILYLEKSLLEYPKNENLEFEIAKKARIIWRLLARFYRFIWRRLTSIHFLVVRIIIVGRIKSNLIAVEICTSQSLPDNF